MPAVGGEVTGVGSDALRLCTYFLVERRCVELADRRVEAGMIEYL